MHVNLPVWLPALSTLATGGVFGWLHREITAIRKLMKGAPMSTQSISLSGYITIGLALIQGMTQEKAIASNAALNQQQKNEQMATVAAQQLGKMLSSVPEIPKEIVTLVEDAQLDEKIIEAGEALVGLVKEFAPKPPEAPKPPTAV